MTDFENGRTVFRVLMENMPNGEECLRKVQTMLNGGWSNERIMGRFFTDHSVPQEAQHLVGLALDFMREVKPVLPWPRNKELSK